MNTLWKIAQELRLDVLEMLHIAGSGHIGGAFGMADIFAALYFSFLRVDPAEPTDPSRDYCLLSNGHIRPIWYATLAKKWFFTREELWKLRKIDALLQGHPKMGIPGVENSSWPLGHGLSQAVGIALALRINNKEIGHPQKVVCCMSDGEHQEGQTWEAIMSANKWQLDNLIVIVDDNGLQIEGTTDEMMPLGNLAEKYRAFGWQAREIDGHDHDDILSALSEASQGTGPYAIIAHTVLGKWVSFMERNWKYHDWPAIEGDYERAKEELLR